MAKKLTELTIKHEFMFGAVMSEPVNCKPLLELSLDIAIGRIEVDWEKNIKYHPQYRSVCLDVYAEDEKNTLYNVEMQVAQKPGLEKRSRYYHSQMDMNILHTGLEYIRLPDAYVIFICDFDPFGDKKYRYKFENKCDETGKVLQDGSKTVFLSTRGENENEVPVSLVKFLKFVRADLQESTKDFEDEFVRTLQDTIAKIKGNRDMEERFMLLEELLREKKAEGKAEGKAEAVLELLEDLGAVSADIKELIMNESNLDVLSAYHKAAGRANSIEEFRESIKTILSD